jgi:Domain of unknown function (DUF5703)
VLFIDALWSAVATGLGPVEINLAANVWTEQNGDLALHWSKADAWTELNKLVKLGLVRIQLMPNPFLGATDVNQSLSLEGPPSNSEAAQTLLRSGLTQTSCASRERRAALRSIPPTPDQTFYRLPVPQNAYAASFNARLRDECLNASWLTSLCRSAKDGNLAAKAGVLRCSVSEHHDRTVVASQIIVAPSVMSRFLSSMLPRSLLFAFVLRGWSVFTNGRTYLSHL